MIWKQTVYIFLFGILTAVALGMAAWRGLTLGQVIVWLVAAGAWLAAFIASVVEWVRAVRKENAGS